MRLLVVALVPAFLVAACAKGDNGTDDTAIDAGTGGRDGATGGDGSKGDGSMMADTGPGCDKCGGSTCLDLKTDKANCGMCGNACTDVCCNGSCVDSTSDNANCGGCGSACMNGNTCCSSSCVDTNSDKSNCGTCGSNCNGTCTNGQCMQMCQVDLGTCAHSPCVTGVKLNDTCDPDGCNDLICNFIDPDCCGVTWDSLCVQEAVFWCSLSCNGC